ncbi:MAG: isoprenyl transferase [Rikenellaceae bacterium]|nr:isoprenyl transferase [Rikenellaceae bacterium]
MNTAKPIPQHVAIIMDGNGRWAKRQGKERTEGHIAGVETIRRTLRAAAKQGVKYLTFYAFSTENWGRPEAEVNALMELLCKSIICETPALKEQGARVRIIGERSRFSEKVQHYLTQIEQDTAEGERITMVLALNYSSRDELRRAMQSIANKVKEGTLAVESIDEKLISDHLDTAFMPDPDLVIRTSGEQRLSNFLMWQASYAEFYFPEVLWPDFSEEDFAEALEVYTARDRRFGKVK